MKCNLHMFKTGGRSVTLSVVIGVAIAAVISLLLNMGLTSLVMNGHIEANDTAFFVFAIRAVSVIAGGLVAAALAREKMLLLIGLTSIGYLLLLIGLGIIFYDSSFLNFGSGVISAAVGAACACVLKLKAPRKKKHSVKYKK